MKLLITGALGQDGRILTNLLHERGDKVIGLPSPDLNLDKAILIDRKLTENLVRDVNPDKILHLASVHGPSGTMNRNWELDRKIFEAGLIGVRNLINAVKIVNPEIQILATASSRVFTAKKSLDLRDEYSEMNPSDFYGKVKERMRHEITIARNNGLKCSTAILFNHYSVFSKGGYLGDVLAEKIYDALRTNTHHVSLRKPNNVADLSHANDICNSLLNILDFNDTEDYILGSGKATSIGEIVKRISQYFNYDLDVKINSADKPEPCVIADITKATNAGVASSSSDYTKAIIEKIRKYQN